MRLYLARHGNTFNPGETSRWVGARTDLPLVESGLAQAHVLADYFRRLDKPTMIITGPLQRTHQTATIIHDSLKLSGEILIDPRLTEIDYGEMENKTAEEIALAGFGDELLAWDKSSIWPERAGWAPSLDQMRKNAQNVLSEVWDGALVVTSNGVLRFFAEQALNAYDWPHRKINTGHLAIMERDGRDSRWHIVNWNGNPAA